MAGRPEISKAKAPAPMMAAAPKSISGRPAAASGAGMSSRCGSCAGGGVSLLTPASLDLHGARPYAENVTTAQTLRLRGQQERFWSMFSCVVELRCAVLLMAAIPIYLHGMLGSPPPWMAERVHTYGLTYGTRCNGRRVSTVTLFKRGKATAYRAAVANLAEKAIGSSGRLHYRTPRHATLMWSIVTERSSPRVQR